MNLNDEQLERIARYLDGEPVDLTPQERPFAERFAADERTIGELLEAPAPAAAMARAGRRLRAAVVPVRRPLRLVSAVGLAAAAAILLAAALWLPTLPQHVPASGSGDELLASVYSRPDRDVDLDVLGEQIEMLEAEIVLIAPVSPLETEIDAIEQKLDTFWLQDADAWLDEG